MMEEMQAPQRRVLSLREFYGVDVNEADFALMAAPIADMMRAVEGLHGKVGKLSGGGGTAGLAAEATAVASLNAAVAAVGGRCTLAPPPAPITLGPNSAGQLVYRCSHPRAHRWDLAGNPMP